MLRGFGHDETQHKRQDSASRKSEKGDNHPMLNWRLAV